MFLFKRKTVTIAKLNDEETIKVRIFGKEKKLVVFSTGDNRVDENGEPKDSNFALSEKEIECLNWLINNVNLNNYKKEIAEYCNIEYEMWSDKRIKPKDVEKEISITAIAINVSEIWKSNDGSLIYPEISFYGDCKCDEEHGICIGFRDKKYLGIASQDWTL